MVTGFDQNKENRLIIYVLAASRGSYAHSFGKGSGDTLEGVFREVTMMKSRTMPGRSPRFI